VSWHLELPEFRAICCWGFGLGKSRQALASGLAPRTPGIYGYLLLGLWAGQVWASLGRWGGTPQLSTKGPAAGAKPWDNNQHN